MPKTDIDIDAVSKRFQNLPKEIKDSFREIAIGMTTNESLGKYSRQFQQLIRTVDALCNVGQSRDNEMKTYRLALEAIADPARQWGPGEVQSYAKAIID